MACINIQSSSPSCTRNFDVFVNFRGEDAYNGFSGHLLQLFREKVYIIFHLNVILVHGCVGLLTSNHLFHNKIVENETQPHYEHQNVHVWMAPRASSMLQC
ncbi:hypothetical protein Fmac_020233 [Flemingia macrophylla]|uniref:TIR domain-containing protein n=1 Tax=Flemingia macrophylla TaxID=520843 RepID=A0ABD1LTF5_9FABA